MTLHDYLEQDKESLLQALENAKDPSDAVPILERECDRLLYSYNEDCGDDDLRSLASSLMQQMRTGSALVSTDGPTTVWEKHTGLTVQGKSPKGSRLLPSTAPGLVSLTSGITCLAVSVAVHFLPGKAIAFVPLLILDLLLPLVGGSLIYAAGRSSKRQLTASGKNEYMTQTSLDTAAVYRIFRAQVLTADRELDRAAGTKRLADQRQETRQIAAVSEKDLKILGDLLEASYSGDGEYALDKLRAVKFRLHQLGIGAVDADMPEALEHPEWFDSLPADRDMTVRPALTMNGQLLLKGLAAKV